MFLTAVPGLMVPGLTEPGLSATSGGGAATGSLFRAQLGPPRWYAQLGASGAYS